MSSADGRDLLLTSRCLHGMQAGAFSPVPHTNPTLPTRTIKTVVDPALGTKRTCPNCAARFYDLGKDPIECPACEATFIAEPILPSKQDQPAPEAAEAAPAPAAASATSEPAKDDIELVSLDDVDDDADAVDDDETAAIADVDLGDAEVEAAGGDDDEDGPFLETDDDDDPGVSDLIGPASAADDNE